MDKANSTSGQEWTIYFAGLLVKLIIFIVVFVLLGLLLEFGLERINSRHEAQPSAPALPQVAAPPASKSSISKGEAAKQEAAKDEALYHTVIMIASKVVLTGFILSILAGYMLGRARSPQFDDPTRSPPYIREYVAKHANITTDGPLSSKYTKIYQSGRLVALGPCLRYRFVAGVTAFLYDATKQVVEKEPAHRGDDIAVSSVPRTNIKFSDAMALLVGGGAGTYSVKSAIPAVGKFMADETVERSIRVAFLTILFSVSGFILGFKIGYSAEPKPGERLFLDLLNDVIFWRGVEEDYIRLNWYQFSEKNSSISLRVGRDAYPKYSFADWTSTYKQLVWDFKLALVDAGEEAVLLRLAEKNIEISYHQQ